MGNHPVSDSGIETLQELANRLQLYKSSRKQKVDHDEEIDATACLNSEMGTSESSCASQDEFGSLVELSRKRRAAVLVCLFRGCEGELRVILTKRSMRMSSYPGDVALPGGKMDEHDQDDTATALREATEEIGLDPKFIQVVTNLEPFFSQHLLKVVPVVGLLEKIEDFKPVLNVDEVDAIFDTPLEMFLEEENHRHEEREWRGLKYTIHTFDFQSSEQDIFRISGLTARILIRVASIVFQRSPSFDLCIPNFQQLEYVLNDEASATSQTTNFP